MGVMPVFSPKLLNIQCGVGRCVCKPPTMKWAHMLEFSVLKENMLKENSLKLNIASHKNASRYPDADGFLKHSPSGASLYYKGPTCQKIILWFYGVPSYFLL